MMAVSDPVRRVRDDDARVAVVVVYQHYNKNENSDILKEHSN